MSRRQKQSFYYQQIAQAFLARRGAPYVLSSQDMVTISSWEKAQVPLRVVLEGIERAFERSRPRLPRGRKMSSLSFCQTEVMKAHAEFKDRRVGRGQKVSSRDEKRKRARREVQSFLDSLSPDVEFLGDAYREALSALSRKNVEEEALERWDERVESLILREAGAAEQNETAALHLIKEWREKYQIPYLSLFYY